MQRRLLSAQSGDGDLREVRQVYLAIDTVAAPKNSAARRRWRRARRRHSPMVTNIEHRERPRPVFRPARQIGRLQAWSIPWVRRANATLPCHREV